MEKSKTKKVISYIFRSFASFAQWCINIIVLLTVTNQHTRFSWGGRKMNYNVTSDFFLAIFLVGVVIVLNYFIQEKFNVTGEENS